MMKKSIALTSLVLAVSLLSSGCGNKPQANTAAPAGGAAPEKKEVKTRTLKIANYFAPDHPHNAILRDKFKPMVEEKSGGTLKVEIYDNNKLGAEKEVYDKVRNGTIEMALTGLGMQGDIPKMGVPEWPFLFKSFDHAKKVFSGPVATQMTDELESKHGVHPLGFTANGFRMFSANKKLENINDFKGLRLRMSNIPNHLKLAELLGANPTPMPITEVFTALEQKVVDGQDAPIAFLRSSGWGELQKQVLESRHMFSANLYIINSKLWKELTPEQQKAIDEAVKASCDAGWDAIAKSYEDDKKWLQDKGLKFNALDDKSRQEMEDATKPMLEELYAKYPWGKEMVEKIKAEGK